MSTATSIRETFLQKMSVLPVGYYPQVLHYVETLENGNDKTKQVSFSPEEWDEFCQDFEHSPEEALAKAYSRGYYPAPQQS